MSEPEEYRAHGRIVRENYTESGRKHRREGKRDWNFFSGNASRRSEKG